MPGISLARRHLRWGRGRGLRRRRERANKHSGGVGVGGASPHEPKKSALGLSAYHPATLPPPRGQVAARVLHPFSPFSPCEPAGSSWGFGAARLGGPFGRHGERVAADRAQPGQAGPGGVGSVPRAGVGGMRRRVAVARPTLGSTTIEYRPVKGSTVPSMEPAPLMMQPEAMTALSGPRSDRAPQSSGRLDDGTSRKTFWPAVPGNVKVELAPACPIVPLTTGPSMAIVPCWSVADVSRNWMSPVAPLPGSNSIEYWPVSGQHRAVDGTRPVDDAAGTDEGVVGSVQRQRTAIVGQRGRRHSQVDLLAGGPGEREARDRARGADRRTHCRAVHGDRISLHGPMRHAGRDLAESLWADEHAPSVGHSEPGIAGRGDIERAIRQGLAGEADARTEANGGLRRFRRDDGRVRVGEAPIVERHRRLARTIVEERLCRRDPPAVAERAIQLLVGGRAVRGDLDRGPVLGLDGRGCLARVWPEQPVDRSDATRGELERDIEAAPIGHDASDRMVGPGDEDTPDPPASGCRPSAGAEACVATNGRPLTRTTSPVSEIAKVSRSPATPIAVALFTATQRDPARGIWRTWTTRSPLSERSAVNSPAAMRS